MGNCSCCLSRDGRQASSQEMKQLLVATPEKRLQRQPIKKPKSNKYNEIESEHSQISMIESPKSLISPQRVGITPVHRPATKMFKPNGIRQTSDNYGRIFSTQERKQENIKQFASAENIFETSKSKAESMRAILQKKRHDDFNMVLFEEQIKDDEKMSAIT